MSDEEESTSVFDEHGLKILGGFVGFVFILIIGVLAYYNWLPNLSGLLLNGYFWVAISVIIIVGLVGYLAKIKYIDLSNPFSTRQDNQLTEGVAYELAYYELIGFRNIFPGKTYERGIEFEGIGDSNDENYNRIFKWDFKDRFTGERVAYLIDLEQPIQLEIEDFEFIDAETNDELRRKIGRIQNKKIVHESDWDNFEEKIEESVKKMAKNIRPMRTRRRYRDDGQVEEIETPYYQDQPQPQAEAVDQSSGE